MEMRLSALFQHDLLWHLFYLLYEPYDIVVHMCPVWLLNAYLLSIGAPALDNVITSTYRRALFVLVALSIIAHRTQCHPALAAVVCCSTYF